MLPPQAISESVSQPVLSAIKKNTRTQAAPKRGATNGQGVRSARAFANGWVVGPPRAVSGNRFAAARMVTRARSRSSGVIR